MQNQKKSPLIPVLLLCFLAVLVKLPDTFWDFYRSFFKCSSLAHETMNLCAFAVFVDDIKLACAVLSRSYGTLIILALIFIFIIYRLV